MKPVLHPYPGLRPFRRDEAELFFGREEQVDQLLENLEHCRFLAVVGVSGCGKSSLVHAGLLPALEAGLMADSTDPWCVAEMRPGNRPLVNLAQGLLDSGLLGAHWTRHAQPTALLSAVLRRGPLGLLEVLEETPLPAKTRLLLLVDQFEEIFRYHRHGDPSEATAFVDLLLASAAAPQVPVYVVLTMRSDFLGACALFAGLPEAMNRGQFLTPRPTREQCRATIIGPADIGEARVEPALINRLLNDMGTDPDQLPLMQHVLMRVWDRASRQAPAPFTLTVAEYQAVGGFAEALSKHADEAYAALEPEQRALAQTLFRGLSEPGTGGEAIRRPVPLKEIAEVAGVDWRQVEAVAEVFRQPGCSFLTPPVGVPLRPETLLDISHESLIRQWGRMQHWYQVECAAAAGYRRLRETARLWRQGKADPLGRLDLENALDWKRREHPTAAWAQRYGGDLELVDEFLQASVRKRKRQHWAEIRRRLLLVAGGFLLVLAVVFLWQWFQTEDARKQAVAQTQIATAQRLAVQGHMIRDANPKLSVLLAVEAVQASKTERVPAAEQALRDALVGRTGFLGHRLSGHGDAISALAMSPDNRWLVTGSVDKSIRLWDLAAPDPTVTAKALRGAGAVRAMAFSRDGNYLVTGADDRAVLWDIRSGRGHRRVALEGAMSTVVFGPNDEMVFLESEQSIWRWPLKTKEIAKSLPLDGRRRIVVFSPDGRTMLTDSKDGTAQLWDMATGKRRGTLAVKGLMSAVYSADGEMLVTADDWNGDIRLWDTTSAELRLELRQHSRVSALALSPDSRWLVAGDVDNAVSLWDLNSSNPRPVVLREPKYVKVQPLSGRLRLTISPDSRWLIAQILGDTLELWDLTAADPAASGVILLSEQGRIASVTISPDSRWLVIGSDNTMTRLWDLQSFDPARSEIMLRGHTGAISALAISADSRWLASGSADNTARLWDLHTYYSPKTPIVLRGHEEAVIAVAIDVPNRRLISAGRDNRIRFWSWPPSESAKPLREWTETEDCSLQTMALSPDQRWLACGCMSNSSPGSGGAGKNIARVWDLSDPAAFDKPSLVLKEHRNSVYTLTFSNDNRLATGSEDRKARIWNLAAPDFDSRKPLRLPGGGEVTVLALSPDGRWLLTGGGWSNDLTAPTLWDLSSQEPSQKRIAELQQERLTGAIFSPDGGLLISGSEDGTIRLWGLTETGLFEHPEQVLQGHQGPVYGLAISTDKRWLLSGSGDNTARLWDLQAADPSYAHIVLRGHQGAVSTVAIGPDNQWLVTGSEDRMIRLWNLHRESLLEEAKGAAGRNLNCSEWRQYFTGRDYRPTFPEHAPGCLDQ